MNNREVARIAARLWKKKSREPDKAIAEGLHRELLQADAALRWAAKRKAKGEAA